MKPLITAADVAELLGLQLQTVYNTRYRSEPPGSLGIRIGNRLRFRVEDIEQFVNHQAEQRK